MTLHGKLEIQKKIDFPTISAKDKELLDLDFASVCYMDGRPFTLYESPAMKRAMHWLHSAYDPPNRQAISGRLLDASFERIKEETNTLLSSLPLLNIITDESDNINHAR